MSEELVEVCNRLGFRLVVDTEFQVALLRPDGATILFGTDPREFPAYYLTIRPKGSAHGYEVWLLMQIKEPALVPSWPEQIAFVEREAEILFENEASYASDYGRANSTN